MRQEGGRRRIRFLDGPFAGIREIQRRPLLKEAHLVVDPPPASFATAAATPPARLEQPRAAVYVLAQLTDDTGVPQLVYRFKEIR